LSVQAVAYARALMECEDGAPLSAGQKLLLICLADYHNGETKDAFPGLPLLAKESLVTVRQAQRYLKYLEEHCVTMAHRPERQGAGKKTKYVFLALDAPRELARRLNLHAKGCQDVTLFSDAERVTEGRHLEAKRVTEGRHSSVVCYKEEPRTKSNQNRTRACEPSSFRDGQNADTESIERRQPVIPEGANVKLGASVWRTVAGELCEAIDHHAFETWLKPAHGEYVLDGWLYLGLPTRDFLEIVTARYRDAIDLQCKSMGLQGVMLLAMEAAR
jgi:hypothetical protein